MKVIFIFTLGPVRSFLSRLYIYSHFINSAENLKTNVECNLCQRPLKCRYCKILNKTGKIKSHSTGKVYTSLKKVHCQSSNLKYVITCQTCSIQYVGQTKNRLLTWFQGHFNDISYDRDTTVSRHLNWCINTESNSANRKFDITIASFITSPPKSPGAKLLRDREEKWIKPCASLTPYNRPSSHLWYSFISSVLIYPVSFLTIRIALFCRGCNLAILWDPYST